MGVEKCLIKFKFRKPPNLGQSRQNSKLIPILKWKGVQLYKGKRIQTMKALQAWSKEKETSTPHTRNLLIQSDSQFISAFQNTSKTKKTMNSMSECDADSDSQIQGVVQSFAIHMSIWKQKLIKPKEPSIRCLRVMLNSILTL